MAVAPSTQILGSVRDKMPSLPSLGPKRFAGNILPPSAPLLIPLLQQFY